MITPALWLVILAMGVITYALRLSMIAVLGRVEVPGIVREALRFVPAAVLAAIVVPELLRPGGTLDISLGNARLLAGVVASLVAWRTRNVLPTIGVGMALLWMLQAVR